MSKLHRLIGLFAGAWLMLMGISGVTLTFYKEIDTALSARYLRASPIPAQPGIDVMLGVVRRAYPDRVVLSFERYGLYDDETYPFVLTRKLPMTALGPDQSAIGDLGLAPALEVFVDPAKATMIGERNYWTWLRVIRSFHKELFVPETGERVVGVLGVILLTTTAAGIVLWWRQGKRNITRALKISWSAPKRRLFRDIHTVGGLYVALFLSVQAISGAVICDWFQVSTWVSSIFSDKPASRVLPSPSAVGPIISADRARDIGLAIHPSSDVVQIVFPTPGLNFYSVRLYPRDQPITRFTRQTVIDPVSGKIVLTFDPSTLPLVRRILGAWAIWIHGGQFFGLAGCLVVLTTGAMLTLMFPTGLYIWVHKRRSRQTKRGAGAALT